jgi:hypothetical protein
MTNFMNKDYFFIKQMKLDVISLSIVPPNPLTIRALILLNIVSISVILKELINGWYQYSPNLT